MTLSADSRLADDRHVPGLRPPPHQHSRPFARVAGSEPAVLCAVLATPPLTSGARTRRQVEAAAELLGCDQVIIVNLCDAAAQDLRGMGAVAADAAPWISARSSLQEALTASTMVLAGWGVVNPPGLAAQHQRQQLAWLSAATDRAGHRTAWCVGGEPRHPSRWHQYVSDRHGRTQGGTPMERLREVLVAVPVRDVTRA